MARPFISLKHYDRRIDKVLEYIDANLARPLQLSTLAVQASFSPNHFHQIFRERQGETPQSYVRRCRLERGAALLHYGHRTAIKEIAPQCGFTSVEAFDRAFHTYFGMTPTEWRRGGYADWNRALAPLRTIAFDLSEVLVQVKWLPPTRVIYKRKLGTYKDGEAAPWGELAQVAEPLDIGGQGCFGIGLDDPSVTPSMLCRFDACIELPTSVNVPVHTPVKAMHGGYHAVLPYLDSMADKEDYWMWLFQVWLPQSGYKVSHNACFEHYPAGMPTAGASVRSELCLPVVR